VVGGEDRGGWRSLPGLRDGPVRRVSLPAPLTSFVGRERAVAGVREVLRRARLVTLTGPGGVGKTRLAIEAARRRRVRSAAAVAFADLGSTGERAAVAAAVADAVGLAAASPGMAEAALGDWLGVQSLLIVLDNCEHVAGACAELVAGLLGRCPGLRVLATSRESLGVPGEVVWTVAPLSLEESRQLFAARARQARATAVPGGEWDAAVRAICRRLEGIPLALELAAAQVAVLSPAEIVPLLEDRFVAWRAGRLAPARQQTLRASIEWSHELLEPAERAAFARLAVFTGAFGREGAREVARADVPMLAALAAKSMIYVVPGPVRTRYRMLDTLRAFGIERLRAAGEEAGIRERHLDWWVSLAEPACGRGTVPASAQGFEELCEDIDDLRAALRFAAVHRPAAGLRLMGTTRELWYRTAQPEGLERSLRFLKLCQEPGRDRAYALITAGRLATTVMDHQLARRLLTEALPMARGTGDDGIEPLARFLLGVSLFLSRQLDQAQRHLSRALVVLC
jgi:predicted ATPase